MHIFKETREYFRKLGLPEGDLYDLPTSTKKFVDGAHFRIEVPTVNTSEAMRKLLETSDDLGVTINRVDMTWGIFRLTDGEIQEYIETAKKHKVELVMGVGPRAWYDTGAQVYMGTIWAHAVGYRLRGMEQVIRAIEDVKRATEMGCRGILVYDEGLLYVLNKMRSEELIPKNTIFKASAVLGYCNPIGFKLLEQLGANSINGQRDLQLPMIAAIRQAVNVPIDIHTDNPPATGEFIRTYEGPEMVRVGSPIYIKTGNVALPRHGYRGLTERDAIEMAKQVSLTIQFINKYYPQAEQSKPESSALAVPE